MIGGDVSPDVNQRGPNESSFPKFTSREDGEDAWLIVYALALLRSRPQDPAAQLKVWEATVRWHLWVCGSNFKPGTGPQVKSSMVPFIRASHFGVALFLTHSHVEEQMLSN